MYVWSIRKKKARRQSMWETFYIFHYHIVHNIHICKPNGTSSTNHYYYYYGNSDLPVGRVLLDRATNIVEKRCGCSAICLFLLPLSSFDGAAVAAVMAVVLALVRCIGTVGSGPIWWSSWSGCRMWMDVVADLVRMAIKRRLFQYKREKQQHNRVIYGVDAVVGSSIITRRKICNIIDQSNAPISDRV